MKRKQNGWSWAIGIMTTVLAFNGIIYGVGAWYLEQRQLQWRPWVGLLAGGILCLWLVCLLVYGIAELARWLATPVEGGVGDAFARLFAALGIFAAGAAVLGICVIAVFIGTMTYQPEHLVTGNGKRCVACVSSFLQVQVDYYEYDSPFTMGKDAILYEDYGNGGYDPFDSH